MAYCLMGIFDINMPLLYGEGGVKAFLRLRQEIIKISSDSTVFAWASPQPSHYYAILHGLLAESVDCFIDSHDIYQEPQVHLTDREPYAMTNLCLRITFPMMHHAELVEFGGTIMSPYIAHITVPDVEVLVWMADLLKPVSKF